MFFSSVIHIAYNQNLHPYNADTTLKSTIDVKNLYKTVLKVLFQRTPLNKILMFNKFGNYT